ncbi:MAG: AAA family ATPase [Spirochaetales bacterium]|nr:AAA family ATPase [Spirochaetales bacterium]
MISLERVRLVGWHYFDDALVPIGEHTLLSGDNGSGKSTIIDALQYCLAANLNRVRFNAAAAERKTGRNLAGYVRGKTGVENGEYLRDDAVAHVMVDFRAGETRFAAGICVEAFREEDAVREFPWIADGATCVEVAVRDAAGRALSGREFRDALRAAGATTFEQKRDYTRELTHRLGVFRRNVEFNPWLEALVRSVSFSPMTVVDRFVCDYILEDRPVDVSVMKANLESYKAAEREAVEVERRIALLEDVDRCGADHAQKETNILLQEYLKARADAALATERFGSLERKKVALEREAVRLETARGELEGRIRALEGERDEVRAALLADDAARLAERLRERRAEELRSLAEAKGAREKCDASRKRCSLALGRPVGADPDDEIITVEAERDDLFGDMAAARRRIESLRDEHEEAAAERAELERGLPRYPEGCVRLKRALEEKGIRAWVLADLAEVDDDAWRNAVEGWLDAARFAVLVEPDSFGAAYEVYAALSPEIGGAPLPDLARQRNARVREGSLARLVSTESAWARLYLDAALGAVIAADASALREYDAAVSADCLAWRNHAATRLPGESYRRWYLGRAARERRLAELAASIERLRVGLDAELATVAALEARVGELRDALGMLREMLALEPVAVRVEGHEAEIARVEAELAALDLSGVRELELRARELESTLDQLKAELVANLERGGGAASELEAAGRALEAAKAEAAVAGEAFARFLDGREEHRTACEAYWAERTRGSDARTLAANYESSVKGARTRLDKAAEAYRAAVQKYNRECNALLPLEPSGVAEARSQLRRYVDSELPAYRERIAKARVDAERHFKEHFVARINEYVEDARESFREINETLKAMAFGRDQYRFTLEERPEKRGQLEVIRKAADIADAGDGLFAALVEPEERRAVEALFERILRNELDSAEVRAICDYRTYFTYDIRLRDLSAVDPRTGKSPETSLARVIREKSGGEAQTPYYVAIAASFYRFFKDDPEKTVRLAIFDEAFNRMDDERIAKALDFFRKLGMQIVTAVPTEKLETVAPRMDSVSLVIRHGYRATVRDFRKGRAAGGDRA